MRVVKRLIIVYIVRIQDPNLKGKPWSINQCLVKIYPAAVFSNLGVKIIFDCALLCVRNLSAKDVFNSMAIRVREAGDILVVHCPATGDTLKVVSDDSMSN